MNRSKIKITIVKCMDTKEIFGDDRSAETSENFLTKCSLFHEGQIIIIDEKGNIPEGFCSWAWPDIHREITLLRLGGNYPEMKNGGSMYVSCSDGLRPVIFKLERMKKK